MTPGRDQAGTWIIDAEGKTIFADQRMADILGTSPAEMIGHPSFTYVFPEDAETAQNLFEAKKDGDPSSFHFKLRRQDGSAVWVDVEGTPLTEGPGTFRGISGRFTVSG